MSKNITKTVTLAVIAKQANVSPKNARRILRKSDIAPVTDARWAFTPANAAKVRALLKR